MRTFFAKIPWFIPAAAILMSSVAAWSLLAAPPKTDGAKDKDAAASKETAKVPAKAKNTKESKKMADEPDYNKLTAEERWVILNKGTEYAFTGRYTDYFVEGTYICKRCNNPLYKSDHKFHSGCGWPAFDDEIKDAIKREVDADGYRVEIMCKNCGGHLGHVFDGEMLTQKNTRHCVNSISVRFVPKNKELPEVIKAKSEKEKEEAESKASAESKDATPVKADSTKTDEKKPDEKKSESGSTSTSGGKK
ncbi:MAG: methionine-R-sulfoxide reductase [Pirellula sp.]|jgi:peptide-methionine (R)-S-oxide reductase